MGVPKFYRWISERYPCLSEVVKEHQIPEFDNLYLDMNGIIHQCSHPNDEDVHFRISEEKIFADIFHYLEVLFRIIKPMKIPEFDNLYLDMNGIIHQCSHPNDEDVHFRISEEKIFADIFHYLEVLFRIIKPMKVFFMAVDGVAPRAKMNQQRGRRFRSAKEAEDKIKKALEKGETLPTEARFDSNCITPGTGFMARLQEQLKYFVNSKISTDKSWQGVHVYLSGHETPGEGEHKIMEFIRSEKAKPDHDPNTRHCLYGLDADLGKISFEYDLDRIIDDWILMGFLVGNDFIPHLPHLHINHDALPLLYRTYISVLPKLEGYINDNGNLNLVNFEKYLEKLSEYDREHFNEVFVDLKWFESKVGNKYLNEAAGTGFMARLQEQLKYFVNSKISTDKSWQGVHVYLSGHETPGEGEHKIMEFIRSEKAKPDHDPNTRHCLYGLDADLGKISFEYDLDRIIDDWILMGFLVGNDFIPHLPHLHINHDALPLLYRTYISVLPKLEGYINDNGNLNLVNFEKYLEKLSEYDREHFNEVFVDLKWFESKVGNKYLNEAAGTAAEEERNRNRKKQKEDSLCLAALDGNKEVDGAPTKDCLDNDNEEEDLFETEFRQYKRSYYMTKMGVEVVSDEFLAGQAECYVLAIQWILHYYYHGVQSWSWYYPHHYAPYLSDIRNFSNMKLLFDMGKPFLPFEQLLGVLPAASKDLLPKGYQDLMISEGSPILEYYPLDFKTDLNGKQQEWEAVVLIPFIDEKRLLAAMEPNSKFLTMDEKQRNRHSECAVYCYDKDVEFLYPSPLPDKFPSLVKCHARYKTIPMDAWHVGLTYVGIKVHNSDVYFCGFPTLKHIKHKFYKKKNSVQVFQQSSRGESMMLEIMPSDEEMPRCEDVASLVLGKSVFVNWPHLEEARVVAVSDGETKFFLEEPLGEQKLYIGTTVPPTKMAYLSDKEQNTWLKEVQGISELFFLEEPLGEQKLYIGTTVPPTKMAYLSDKEQNTWLKEVQGISEFYNRRKGIVINETAVLLFAQLLTGRKYVLNQNGEVHLEKQWSKQIIPFVYQAVVKDIVSFDSSFSHFKTIDELFSPETTVFMLGNPYYGCMGETQVSSDVIGEGRIRVIFTIPCEPQLDALIQNQHKYSIRYNPGYVLASRLGISGYLVSRFSGSIFIGRGSKRNQHGEQKANVGLNLKFNKKNEEVPGYTKKSGNEWLYSVAVEELLAEYVERYSAGGNERQNIRVLKRNEDYNAVSAAHPLGSVHTPSRKAPTEFEELIANLKISKESEAQPAQTKEELSNEEPLSPQSFAMKGTLMLKEMLKIDSSSSVPADKDKQSSTVAAYPSNPANTTGHHSRRRSTKKLAAHINTPHVAGAPQHGQGSETSVQHHGPPQPPVPTVVTELSRVCASLGMSQPEFGYLRTPQGMAVCQVKLSSGLLVHGPQCQSENEAEEKAALFALQRLSSVGSGFPVPQHMFSNLQQIRTAFPTGPIPSVFGQPPGNLMMHPTPHGYGPMHWGAPVQVHGQPFYPGPYQGNRHPASAMPIGTHNQFVPLQVTKKRATGKKNYETREYNSSQYVRSRKNEQAVKPQAAEVAPQMTTAAPGHVASPQASLAAQESQDQQGPSTPRQNPNPNPTTPGSSAKRRPRKLAVNFDAAKISLLYPNPGWVELDPEELWLQFVAVAKAAVQAAGLQMKQITALGISTQRATFTTWSRKTGETFHNFISWQDRRASELVTSWNNSFTMKALHGSSKVLHFITRRKQFLAASIITFSTQHVTFRLAWALQNLKKVQEAVEEGNCCFGTIDTWLLYRLTKGAVHATDYSNASATGIFDSYQKIKSIMKITMGTGTFININTGNKPHTSIAGLYPLVGWKIGQEVVYLAEGNAADTGTAIKWAQELDLFSDPAETEAMANSVPDADGVCFVPSFSGLQAPLNDPHACASFMGLKPSTTKSHLVRAILESIAFRNKQLYKIMSEETHIPVTNIWADGGVCNNNFVMQLTADLFGRKINRPRHFDMSSLGAAFIAGLGIGFWSSKEELKCLGCTEKVFYPQNVWKNYKPVIDRWEKALTRSMHWYSKP
ncbi:UNVERIFIED_CONTAM: hypothetical protein FKN15_043272 [Acipenser sinensis]